MKLPNRQQIIELIESTGRNIDFEYFEIKTHYFENSINTKDTNIQINGTINKYIYIGNVTTNIENSVFSEKDYVSTFLSNVQNKNFIYSTVGALLNGVKYISNQVNYFDIFDSYELSCGPDGNAKSSIQFIGLKIRFKQ